jgi:hypothetical protein
MFHTPFLKQTLFQGKDHGRIPMVTIVEPIATPPTVASPGQAFGNRPIKTYQSVHREPNAVRHRAMSKSSWLLNARLLTQLASHGFCNLLPDTFILSDYLKPDKP